MSSDLAVTQLHVNLNLEIDFAVQVHMGVTLLNIAVVLITCVQIIYWHKQELHVQIVDSNRSVSTVHVQ